MKLEQGYTYTVLSRLNAQRGVYIKIEKQGLSVDNLELDDPIKRLIDKVLMHQRYAGPGVYIFKQHFEFAVKISK